jgi:putative copper export protein
MIQWLPCVLFLQQAEEALSVGRVGTKVIEFIASFAIFGALGFYFFVLRRTAGLRPVGGAADPLAGVAGAASGFWILGGLAGAVLVLRTIAAGRWTALVNPLHGAAASLWIGTLFVVVVVGLPAILRSSLPADRRGPLIAELVARFSSLALAAAALLGVTGIITAWRHLKYLAALWTTPYGYAFDIKMCVVLVVVGLGAWNWRRMRPRLGTEAAAHELRRSATAELAFAAVVLVITAVLVSLPTPKLPG